MAWDGIDRRKFPRVNYPCLVVIGDVKSDENVLLTHTENVGIGGVCVTLKKDLKMFTSVNIELDLLDFENHIRCKGKVVWSVQRKESSRKKPLFYDIGIEFENIEDAERDRLNKIVAKLAKDSRYLAK